MTTISACAPRVKPFLKWPGGKRWLSRYILHILDGQRFRRYFEPFLGGGAVFFALSPETAVLSDVNADLINAYVQVRRQPLKLISLLQKIYVDGVTYQRFRELTPVRPIDKAVRFLYLNRTAFGGMYRLNQSGVFNVPYGGGARTPAPLWEENLVANASHALKGANLSCGDFDDVLAEVRSGDLVYCDPTYTVAHDNNGFVRYNERNFRWDDQERLASTCERLARRGATVLVSNAAHDKILELYRSWEVHPLSRMSGLCPDSEKRRRIKEFLFVSRNRRPR